MYFSRFLSIGPEILNISFLSDLLSPSFSRQFKPEEVAGQGTVTGKPLEQGGISGRTEATGLGVFFGIREVLNDVEWVTKLGMTPGVEGKRIIVQGFGNGERWAMAEAGRAK